MSDKDWSESVTAFCAGMLLVIMLAVICLHLSGCRVVEVNNLGTEVVRDAEGRPIMLADGTAQTVSRGWSVYHNQHWMATQADRLTASIKDGEITFALNGLNSEPSTNLNALVSASVEGAVKAAIAIGGK